jgi:arylsulfatase A-like enzyme/regulation of enolase protein 1 (concanavalin A-like superfamily)
MVDENADGTGREGSAADTGGVPVDRREFVQAIGLGVAGLSSGSGIAEAQSAENVVRLDAVSADPDGQGGTEHLWKVARLSVAEAVASQSPPVDETDLEEIQQAIDWWEAGDEVPDTGGETIDLREIQDLIDRWATGATDGIDIFNPTLSLTAGEEYSVEWTNGDGDEHSFVIADVDGNELVSSATLSDQGATETVTFTATTEMAEYYCGTHPEPQRGTVDVGQPPDRPNVIIIMADDMGYGDTSVPPFTSDDPTPTPNLEAMAANGAKFTSQYNAAPVCTPTRAALLTGSYPPRVGMTIGVYFPPDTGGLNPDETTIAEVLKQQGYATGMVGKWHLGHVDPFLPPNQGFDTYFGVPYSNDMDPFPLLDGFETVQAEAPNSQLTQLYTEQATQFIEDNQDRPFFLYVPHTMPHVPLGVSGEFDGKTGEGTYADVIRELDWSVGRILDQLQTLGIEEETLVVFTTDDGPWLSKGDSAGTSGPLRDGKFSTYEGGARAPTIVHMPGTVPAGTTCDVMTSHIDFLPTVANLAGAPLPEVTVDGEDITNVLANPETASSPHEYIYYYDSNGNLEAIRNAEGWKYHFNGELYDLTQDIDESNDVSGANPGIVDQLHQQGTSFDSDLQANARPEGDLDNVASVSVGSTAANGTTTVTFANDRAGTATGVSLSASSPDDGVTVDLSSTSLGSVDPGGTAGAEATISLPDGTSEAFVRAEATYTAGDEQRTTAAGEQVSVSTLDPVPDQYSTFNNGSQNPIFGSQDGSLIIEGTGGVFEDSDAYSSIYLDDGLQSTGTAVAKVTDVDRATEFSTGDLMVRNDITNPGESPGYALVSVNQQNAEIKIDENGDGNIQSAELTAFDEASGLPKWLRIQRGGETYTASYSPDGSNWTQIAAFELEEASTVQDVGVAVTSSTDENARVEFGEFQVTDTSDIGALPEEYSTFNNGSSDPNYGALSEGFFLEGTGKAAGSTDEYTAVYLDDGLSTGATAVARIDSVELVSEFSTGGFIVRNDITNPGASQGYAQIGVNENTGETKIDQDGNGFLDEEPGAFDVNGLPVWLRLERNGTGYTVSSGPDGSTWTEVASFDLENASDVQDIGIAVTAPADENTRVEVGSFDVA